jgi:hypothetical protein
MPTRCSAISRAASSKIWLPELGVVDRCTSCHVGLKEASLTDVARSPIASIRRFPHKLDQFGCTVCHRGQGAATTGAEAHNSTLAWEQPILPAKYIESSCGQCHRGSIARNAATESRAQSALSRQGCVHCHTREAARRQHDESNRRSAVALAHCRQDYSRVGFCMAERSASICVHFDHAEFQAER